jgi:arylformamidase
MTLYDATMPLRPGMLTFPGDPPFSMEPLFQCSNGDPFNLSALSLSTHLGTHVDPPLHYIEGAAPVDALSLDVLVGPGIVLDMRGTSRIDRFALEQSDAAVHARILLKTDNGRKLMESQFFEDYVSLTEDGAQYLVEQRVKLVGIDYLSIESCADVSAPVHRILLQAGVVIVEGALLEHIPVGRCRIYCLPLNIAGADGAPARLIVEADPHPEIIGQPARDQEVG